MNREYYSNNIYFLQSAARVEQLPPDVGCEIAFIGSSNVGKSSAINVIAGVKGLARIGKTPGTTRLINVFVIDAKRRLIDLPGYGYAKISHQARADWQKLINHYLQERHSLCGLFLLMDIRHPLKDTDKHLLDWTSQAALPVCVLLTKADKLQRIARNITLQKVNHELKSFGGNIVAKVFSAHDRIGLDEVFKQMDVWFEKCE